MGDIADAMIDGDLCQSCGQFIGDGQGFPRDCNDCKARRTGAKKAKEQRRIKAALMFAESKALAAAEGLELVQNSEIHYQLHPPGKRWQLNIYPTNRRLYSNSAHGRKRPPFIQLKDDWSLLDVVQAMIAALNTRSKP